MRADQTQDLSHGDAPKTVVKQGPTGDAVDVAVHRLARQGQQFRPGPRSFLFDLAEAPEGPGRKVLVWSRAISQNRPFLSHRLSGWNPVMQHGISSAKNRCRIEF